MLGRPRLAAKPTANSMIIRPSEQILQSHLRARGPEYPYKQQDTVERGRGMAIWDESRLEGSGSCHCWAWQHMGHLGLSPRSALNGARGQSSPMISARMMPDRKSKVDCSTCRTADPARNPCSPTAHAQQNEHVKARGCKFFFPFPPKEPEAA